MCTKSLSSRCLKLCTPLGYLVCHDPSTKAWSDSCLYATNGWSTNLGFWWYIEWPKEIPKHTLIYFRCNKDGRLININVLEYAAELI